MIKVSLTMHDSSHIRWAIAGIPTPLQRCCAGAHDSLPCHTEHMAYARNVAIRMANNLLSASQPAYTTVIIRTPQRNASSIGRCRSPLISACTHVENGLCSPSPAGEPGFPSSSCPLAAPSKLVLGAYHHSVVTPTGKVYETCKNMCQRSRAIRHHPQSGTEQEQEFDSRRCRGTPAWP